MRTISASKPHLLLPSSQRFAPEIQTFIEKQSKNKTPSAEFKCETCNLNLVSNDQLQVHLTGKKHLKKVQSGGKSNPSTEKSQSKLILCILSIILIVITLFTSIFQEK